jgi:hypothetical protein
VLESLEGNWVFYLWMTALTAVFLVGANAWAVQVRDGMQVTNMSDHVSWGLYIANFTFLVGLAAGGVMMVIPAYLYHDEEMHDLTLMGELLALPLWLNGRSHPPRGSLFIPFFDQRLLVNDITLGDPDPISFEPDYKKCAATLSKLGGAPTTARL